MSTYIVAAAADAAKSEGEKDMAIVYTALGDSLTVGVGAGFFQPGFVPRYKKKMEEDLKQNVTLAVFAKSSLTTAEILSMLDRPFIRNHIDKADAIMITGCGNDLIQSLEAYKREKDQHVFLEASSHCQKNYSAMLKKIRELKEKNERYFIRLLNLYNPFPEIELAEKWISGFNAHLQQLQAAPYVKVVDIHSVFKGHESEYLSFDKVHPNSAGYEAIAEKLREAGYKPLKIEEC